MGALQDFTVGIFGFVMFGVCGLVFGISCMLANGAKMKAYGRATGRIRQWVEINLNEKYQQKYGIRWNISEERVSRGHGKHRRTVTYLHIIVQCVEAAGGGVVMQQPQQQVVQVYNPNIATQPQQIVYVDQNGNPVNPQQIQVVQVHNPDTALNTEAQPPVYEPAEASAPQQKGHTNC